MTLSGVEMRTRDHVVILLSLIPHVCMLFFSAGNTNTDFALAGTTGVLTVAATFGLSKATTSSYTLVIHATDSGTPTLTGTTSLSITVSESSSAQSLMPMVAFIAIGTAIPFL